MTCLHVFGMMCVLLDDRANLLIGPCWYTVVHVIQSYQASNREGASGRSDRRGKVFLVPGPPDQANYRHSAAGVFHSDILTGDGSICGSVVIIFAVMMS